VRKGLAVAGDPVILNHHGVAIKGRLQGATGPGEAVTANTPGGPNEYTYGYIVADVPGGPVVQVTRHTVGYGPASWLLDFTEHANPQRLVARSVLTLRDGGLSGYVEVCAGIAADDVPTTLPDLLQRLDLMGIDDMTGRMPYIDQYGGNAPVDHG
jgi:hypothetical protein